MAAFSIVKLIAQSTSARVSRHYLMVGGIQTFPELSQPQRRGRIRVAGCGPVGSVVYLETDEGQYQLPPMNQDVVLRYYDVELPADLALVRLVVSPAPLVSMQLIVTIY